ncbi:MAG: cyclic pyranopterin monophosphate synthase MoaC [Thermoplasmata archaeon]
MNDGIVDISDKKISRRESIAEGKIVLKKNTIEEIKNKRIKKGDVFEAAKIAGILAIKNTPYTIPETHNIPIESIEFSFFIEEDGIKVRCKVKTTYKTGVEIESLNGVMVALLTIWDMVKYLEKDEDGQYKTTLIKEIRVIEKKKDFI